MPKDFSEFATKEENYSKFQPPKEIIDPNLFTNESLEKEICVYNNLSWNNILLKIIKIRLYTQ